MILVRNESTIVGGVDFRNWIFAIDFQVSSDFANAWSVVPPIIADADSDEGKRAGPDTPLIRLVDVIDVDDALGYHSESGDRVVGLVGAKTCQQYGASISQCVSHEVLEACKDPFVNVWVDGPKGTSWAFEMCDQVQDGIYKINDVEVSNFLYPVAFDAQATKAPFDRLGALSTPFSRTVGGYAIIRTGGQGTETQLGSKPPWKVAPNGRSKARMGLRL